MFRVWDLSNAQPRAPIKVSTPNVIGVQSVRQEELAQSDLKLNRGGS